MKFHKITATAVLGLMIAGGALPLIANPPTTPPPHGNAYGYYARHGMQLLFVYEAENGYRHLELSHCRPNAAYLIEYSEDMFNWDDLVVLRVAHTGTASFVHTDPLPKCFYRVTQVKHFHKQHLDK